MEHEVENAGPLPVHTTATGERSSRSWIRYPSTHEVRFPQKENGGETEVPPPLLNEFGDTKAYNLHCRST
jgi:hypothetical protein